MPKTNIKTFTTFLYIWIPTSIFSSPFLPFSTRFSLFFSIFISICLFFYLSIYLLYLYLCISLCISIFSQLKSVLFSLEQFCLLDINSLWNLSHHLHLSLSAFIFDVVPFISKAERFIFLYIIILFHYISIGKNTHKIPCYQLIPFFSIFRITSLLLFLYIIESWWTIFYPKTTLISLLSLHPNSSLFCYIFYIYKS